MVKCPRCRESFEVRKIEESFDLNIPLVECPLCKCKVEYRVLRLAGDRPSYSGYRYIYFDRKTKKVYDYSEWPGSADDAGTEWDQREMSIEEGVEYLEKYYPEAKKSIEFLKSLIK